jgi:hypothetical protein
MVYLVVYYGLRDSRIRFLWILLQVYYYIKTW